MSDNNSSNLPSDTPISRWVVLRSYPGTLGNIPWLAEGIAILSGVLFLVQSLHFAHSQDSVLDEGAYLYKGFLFATGRYTPFQKYGVWTNQMPLSFLIPGYVQLLLGPGIRTGRYLAIFLGLLILAGLWVLARRLGGRWWAAAIVFLFVWNPTMSKMYSVAVSQVLVASTFIWVLVLTIGENRTSWQIIAGSFLAGVMVMTRLNMAVVPALLLLYIFWQHGWKMGGLSAMTIGLTVGIGHALFWPGILQTWAAWLPLSATPYLDPWRLPAEYSRFWNPNISLEGRLISFFRSFRFHFVAMTSVLAALLLWPIPDNFQVKDRWKHVSWRRASVFLVITFLTLLFLHMWATLGKDYCVFCLEGYLAFFSTTGLTLLVVSSAAWMQKIPGWRQWVIVVVILALATGIGFSAYEEISRPLYNTPIPRILLGTFKPGFVSLGAILENKFHLAQTQVWRLLPAIAGLLGGMLILGLALLIGNSVTQCLGNSRTSYGYWAVITFLILGIILTPTSILGGGYHPSDCAYDTIQSFQESGQHLAKYIPPGSSVYWKGGLSVVPLLYVPEIKIYPPQINNGYSHVKGDTQVLIKFGLWNDELDEQWARSADYILIERRSYEGWLKEYVNSGFFDELPATPPTVLCREDYAIRIFRRRN